MKRTTETEDLLNDVQYQQVLLELTRWWQEDSMIRPVLTIALLLVPTVSCAQSLDELAGWMTGSFSSAVQAGEDESYYDIRLEMVRIWPEREDAVWLYVEQATASHLEQPYRQRVYRVTESGEGEFASAVYSLESPLRFAGDWAADAPLSQLAPDSLAEREGCVVFLAWTGESFSGSTDGDSCTSSLRGASYATSEVEIREDRIVSWDRGFDSDGNHVWGAEEGGYVFLRQ